jgi:hypothetical protein
VTAATEGRTTREVSGRKTADPRRWRALAVVQLAAFMAPATALHHKINKESID